ncbi:MAG: sodium:proline symporter [Ignavibacteriales bacterium CG07_land_8_20_14_0_80_59_12]|nr:MAG: sodium:proline symporter [Ignavibacteriales bacterium CG07_land_8_20_14_0_80_59_12]
MQLTLTDWIVIAAYFLFNLAIGLYYRKRATQSVSDFFVGGRKVTWWLAGTSMVATTFAADTPLAVTGLVARNGIAGNWIWWSMVFSGMLTVFFYARLWRRAGVLTDVEFAEIRYSGKPASFLRGFRALYLGLPVNLIIMGWVNLAIVKIMMLVLGVGKVEALGIAIVIMFITASISTLSGLWGVLVTDLFQFVLKMGMVIVLAIFAVQASGGMDALMNSLHAVDRSRQATGSVLSFIPDLNSTWMPMITFFVYIAVNWWASWYPGAEPGGGGYIAQRILSAKDEKNGLLATLWFNIAHYALRPWPWILVALVAVARYQADPSFAADPESGYVRILISDLPASLRGLMIAAFAAAYMSTIGTQLNWGASYLVNDFYRRFIVKTRPEKHYVKISQAATMVLMILSAVVTFYMDSIAGAWMFLIALGAGTGLVYILRWFWWRINAWSEISALAAAFMTSLIVQFGFHLDQGTPKEFAYIVLITAGVTSAVWLAVTFLTEPEPKEVLLAFYRRVRPSAALWGPIAREATDIVPQKDGFFNLIDWLSGVIMIYGFLFGAGKIIFGETLLGIVFIAIGLIFGAIIYADLNRRGWKTIGE